VLLAVLAEVGYSSAGMSRSNEAAILEASSSLNVCAASQSEKPKM
jgi:hypothetical protein